jgi:hypothetical protein
MKKFTLNLKKCIFFSVSLCVLVFSGFEVPEEQTTLIQDFLTKYYDLDAQSKQIKRFEINLTNTGFCRYRRFYTKGKEEYFAFNLARFKSMDYYGNETSGDLYIRTQKDDVIVQTRNDRQGEVDSTATFLVIPLRNVTAAQLTELEVNFRKINQQLSAIK